MRKLKTFFILLLMLPFLFQINAYATVKATGNVKFVKAGILDIVPNATVAYSLRKLSANYTGSLIQVRRDSDNTVKDIGFYANENLDTTILLAFVGAGSGYVSKWYDQSGNGNHATQSDTAKQPMIVNAGTLVTQNGRPSVYFNSANSQQLVSGSNSGITGNPNLSSAGIYADIGGAPANWRSVVSASGGTSFAVGLSDQLCFNVDIVNSYIYASDTPANFISRIFTRTGGGTSSIGNALYLSGVSRSVSVMSTIAVNFSSAPVYIGSLNGTYFWNGYISEIVLWNNKTLSTAEVGTLATNQISYYGL